MGVGIYSPEKERGYRFKNHSFFGDLDRDGSCSHRRGVSEGSVRAGAPKLFVTSTCTDFEKTVAAARRENDGHQGKCSAI